MLAPSVIMSSKALRLPSAVTDALRPALSAAAAAPFKIIPPEYERLEGPVATVGSTLAAGTIGVVAWPFVLLSDDQVAAALGAISGPGGAGAAVVSGLASVSSTAQGDAQAKAASMAPVFLATGFISDPGVNQTITRGYLWIAASWAQAMPSTTVRRAMSAIMSAALASGGSSLSSSPTKPSSGQVGNLMTAMVAAGDESDTSLEDAAKKAVLATAQAATAIAGAILGNISVSFGANRARSELNTAASLMVNAERALQQAPGIVAGVDALTAQALSQPAEAHAAAGTSLLSVKRQLLSHRQAILGAAQQAPALLRMCAAESSPETSQVAKGLRDQVVADAHSRLATYANVPSVARKFAMATLWRRAQVQLDGVLRGLSEQIHGMCAVAQAIVDNASSVQELIAAIDSAVAKIDYTYGQLQISWLARDFMGVPTYYWVGGGAAVMVGLVAWRIRAKRRAAAAARTVSKNKRRRRIR